MLIPYLLMLPLLAEYSALEYPQIRVFKNSRLTFKSNESVVLDVDDESLNYFFLADQGGVSFEPYYTPVLQYTAKLMSKLAPKLNTHFQFALGDNFYFDGVQNVDDPRFLNSFENVFNDSYLKVTPWFLTLGNHDYRGDTVGNATAQIEYTQKSERWILPNTLYDIDFNLNSKLLMKVVVIDTQLICDEGNDIEREMYLKKVEQKIKYHSDTLASYFIVAGHYPVWSTGEKGTNQCMVDKVRPLLHRYRVNAYLSGDEHTMSHFTDNYLNNRVEYLISGSSNFIVDSEEHLHTIPDQKMIKFLWNSSYNQTIGCTSCVGAFVTVKATQSSMNFSYIDTNNNLLHSITLKPRVIEHNGSNLLYEHQLNMLYLTLFIILIVS